MLKPEILRVLRSLDAAHEHVDADSALRQRVRERVLTATTAPAPPRGLASDALVTADHRTPARSRRLRLAAVPAALAIAAGAFAVTRPDPSGELVLAAPSAESLATWQAEPQPVTGATRERNVCLSSYRADLADSPDAAFLLEERRGALTAMIATYQEDTVFCIVGPDDTGLLSSMSGLDVDVTDRPTAGLSAAVSGGRLEGPVDERTHYATGRYAEGVDSIRFTLNDGRAVTASMVDGWYTAWWNGEATSDTAEVTWTGPDGGRSSAAYAQLPL